MSVDLHTIRHPDKAEVEPAAGDLHLFRFRLRQLLLLTTAVSLLLAGIVSTDGLTAAVLLLATAVIVFHLFSTAVATQLRSHTDRIIARDAAPAALEHAAQIAPHPQFTASMERSPWHARDSTPLPWLPRFIAAASLCGGAIGALVLVVTTDRSVSPAGIAVGAMSIAVVAGWFAFLGYSFYGVFRHGLRQAMADERRDQPR